MTLADRFARSLLSTSAADGGGPTASSKSMLDLVSAAQEAKYPMLHCRQRLVDDLLLQEVFLNLLHCELDLTPYLEWRAAPEHLLMFNVTETTVSAPPQLIGGMLLADRYFLFDEMPFVRCRVRDMRCRLDLQSLLDGEEAMATMVQIQQQQQQQQRRAPPTPSSSSGAVSDPSSMMTTMSPASHNNNSSASRAAPAPNSGGYGNSVKEERLRKLSHIGIAASGGRVHFHLEEFECSCVPWVVQRFQLIDANLNVTVGPVFVRAFQPDSADANNNNGNPNAKQSGDGGSLISHSDAQNHHNNDPMLMSMMLDRVGERTRALRKAVPGEERLRILKPWLYDWCLQRNPADMGTAATIVKEVLLYFRHTFSVVRTVKQLMNAVRTVQLFTRRALSRKKLAVARMLAEWSRREASLHQQLCSIDPTKLDPIDAVVNEVLRAHCFTPMLEKRLIIDELHARHLVEFKERRRKRAQFYISTDELILEFESRLMQKLCDNGHSPIFEDERVRHAVLGNHRRLSQQQPQQPQPQVVASPPKGGGEGRRNSTPFL